MTVSYVADCHLPWKEFMTTPLSAITLKLYDENNEVKQELSRSFIPWGILEIAIDLQEEFDNIQVGAENKPANIEREQLEKLTDFILFLFGNKVTADELKTSASLEDMFSTFQQVFVMVSQMMTKNPTIGQALKRKAKLPQQ